ncbi:MAG TPA: rhamnogalacturonan acetylesterase [Chthonomonadaceae bacterium]|nr:rhamnogalacturonan acetylesterase [Chthonomonadaceae bacterium]
MREAYHVARHSNWIGLAVLLALLGAAVHLASASGQIRPSPAPLPTLYLIGDSTVHNTGAGFAGWGDQIGDLFDQRRIRVVNRASGGRSSRTFRTEGLWQQVRAQLKPGDFVLMQFGHNDGGSLTQNRARASLKGSGDETEEVRYPATGKSEAVHTYGWYMRQYAAVTRASGATPILLSPVPRNIWKEGRTVARASADYGKWAADAAKAEAAIFVDLNEAVAKRYEALGPDRVKQFFPGDHTHTSPTGARLNAECIAEGLRELKDRRLVSYLLAMPEGSPRAAPN